MNNTQQKYLKQRLDRLAREKEDNLRKTYPDTYISNEQKLESIKEGKFTILDKDPSRYTWYNLIVFDGDISNQALRNEKTKEIRKESDAILDQLMLGEEDGLLEALRAFEQKEF